MSTKLEALANLFCIQSPTNTLESIRESITQFVNCKYQLAALNDKYVTDFMKDFDDKIFGIKNGKKTNKELNVKDEVLKVFKDDLLDFYRNYAIIYEKEVEKISFTSIDPEYKKVLEYLQQVTTNETALKLNSFKISNQERLIYPKCFARILEIRVITTFGFGVVNYVKKEIKKLSTKTKKPISDVWNNYYGQNFAHSNFKSDFTLFIKVVKNSYDSYTSAVDRLILLFNRKVEIPKTNKLIKVI